MRTIISQAAEQHSQDPRSISFLETFQHIQDVAPILTATICSEQRGSKRNYLFELIASCLIDRPRRPRLNPRVVKVKMSKFARKNADHKSQVRDIVQDLKIIEISPTNLSAAQTA